MGRSIVARLTSWYAGSLFFLLFCALIVSYFSLSKILESEGAALLQDRMEYIVGILAKDPEAIKELKYKAESEWPSRKFEHLFIRIIDPNGNVLINTPTMAPDLDADVFTKLSKVPSSVVPRIQKMVTSSGESCLALDALIPAGQNPHSQLKLIALLNLNFEDSLLGNYRKILGAILLCGLIAATVVGTILATLLFSPVQKIISDTRQLRSSSLHKRLNVKGLPLELEVLSQTINEMLTHLEESFHRLSQFSSDLAHEIRTPINNIRGEIEVALSNGGLPDESSELLLSVNEEVSRISSLVDNLLFVAKSEDPSSRLVKSEVNVQCEVANILDFYEVATLDKKISVECLIDKSATIFAEKTLFQRAVNNVLANAIRYTGEGGKITASLAETSGTVSVTIADNGCGISADDLPKLFDRFFRVDHARTTNSLGGFGLGLTIVKGIMTLHKGSVSIESEPGRGTRISLNFPKNLV